MTYDYNNYEPGRFPDPKERRRSTDFPPVHDLGTYGVDLPVPTTRDDLRCRYNETPAIPLVLSELDGYRIPPLGLLSVGVGGSGHAKGFIYPNGVFRPDVVSIGQLHGANTNDLQVARADAKTKAITTGIQEAFQEAGREITGKTDADTLQAFAKLVTEKALDDDAPLREVRMWYNDVHKIMTSAEEVKAERNSLRRKMEELGIQALDVILAETKRAKELKELQDGNTIDGDFEDVEDEPFGFDLDGDDED